MMKRESDPVAVPLGHWYSPWDESREHPRWYLGEKLLSYFAVGMG